MTRLVVVSGLLTMATAFYLPGVAPREYKSGEKVELKALTSARFAHLAVYSRGFR